MRLKHIPIIIFSGGLWFFVGLMLMSKGINAALQGTLLPSSTAWLPFLAKLLGDNSQAALAIVVTGLFLGFFKGRFVLSKSAKRVVERLVAMEEPVAIEKIYSRQYCILLAVMIGLGMSMKYISLPLDVKGLIDTTIGSALMNGSLFYFRFALMLRKQKA